MSLGSTYYQLKMPRSSKGSKSFAGTYYHKQNWFPAHLVVIFKKKGKFTKKKNQWEWGIIVSTIPFIANTKMLFYNMSTNTYS